MLTHLLVDLSVTELLAAHSAVLAELRNRGVLRSSNNPTGDYTEWLVAERLGLRLNKNSEKGYDATDADGVKYQIKGRKLSPSNASTQLGVIRDLDKQEFDFLIAVVFEPDWQVKCAAKIPHAVIGGLAKHRTHVNGHVVHVRPSLFDVLGVIDVTQALKVM
ncbi:hypothetical protein WK24_25540 [Burkholderia vietnamiensis]|uniref:DUF6998 domain-containing protein n=1 Tax=Burkholderia vietnamiensis TaxID=60552 RepID=UPI000759B429|nr:hypothetical protein [Burkholderia vietnamiensis]KVR84266.1 hypothetical protein WK24_25540 [Burkholderia vietnamiensis]MCA8180223.1 hypothetical protein [Burkholderia vietnamiensis]